MLRVPTLAFAFFAFFSASAIPFAAETTPAPLSPDEAVRAMRLPPGFQASLVAAEPDVVQPISFCLDDRGRLFVAEALNYGAWQPTGQDRITILADTDGDGRADRRRVFYEGFNYITGIEVGFGGVWVMSPPGLYFVPDRDRDDRPDSEPVLLFDGFGHKESRHNLANGFTWGPDGWLYAGHGRTSPSDVGRPGTPPEQRIHCDGGVYRVHPTRLVFENFADGTTNPWGVDFDDFGQCFVSNCVNPHLFHVLPGGHYEPWRNRPSSQFAYERLPTIADHLHYPTGRPNAMRGETAETLAMGGGHAHCGTLVYLGDTFPASFRNTVFLCNVHGRRINHDLLAPRGSGYTARHGTDLMIAGDPWFMGVTLRTGPDGSVLVSDWSDTGECHTYKPNKHTGRIYRLSYGPPRPVTVDLAAESDEALVKFQSHRNDWFVRHARRLLHERATESNGRTGLTAMHDTLHGRLTHETDVPRRLRALWALYVTGGLSDARLRELLHDPSDHVRGWAVRLLCENIPPRDLADRAAEFAALAAREPSAVVRLSLASALQRLPLEARWEIAAALLAHGEDADDANLPRMLWYAVEPLVPADPARAVALGAAAKLPLVRQFAARRFAEHAVASGERGDLTPLLAAVRDARDSAVARDLLTGCSTGVQGRKKLTVPPLWPALYTSLSQHDDATIRDHAVGLALLFGDARALADLRRLAANASAPAEERRGALAKLLAQGGTGLAPLLHDLLDDPALRGPALRGLAAHPHGETSARVLARYATFAPVERQDAVATLAARRDSALALLDGVERRVVPRSDISAYVARQLHLLGDERVTERLRQAWGDVRDTSPQKQQQLARYKTLLTASFLKKANLDRGRELYAKNCRQCHVLFGDGTRIGPDLTGTNRSNLDYLLSNLIDPSAEIGQDFRLSIVTTTNGRVVSGLVLERTPSRLVLQTATERVVLSAEDIAEVRVSPLSMMPEGQLDRLSPEEIRDLIAYLASPRD